jgi:cell division protein ZapA
MISDNGNTRPNGDESTAVRVTILDQEYPIRADADAEYIREIAAFLDDRLRTIYQAEPSRPLLKIAILTALNLSDELFTLRRENQELVERFERKVREFTDHLNRGLLE